MGARDRRHSKPRASTSEIRCSIADLPNHHVSILIDEALDVAAAVAAIPDEPRPPAEAVTKAAVTTETAAKAPVVTEATTEAAMASAESATVTAEAAPRRCFSGTKSGDTENERRCNQSN